jgi:hypothetical protein
MSNILAIPIAASINNILSTAKHNAGFYFLAEYNARLAAPEAALSPSFSDPPASIQDAPSFTG